MQSRLAKEGSVGLLIVAGVASFLGLFAWIYNLNFAGGGYRFTVLYSDARGLAPGSMVKLRGVRVGRVQQVTPGAEQVEVVIRIDGSIQLPRQSLFKTSQTGLVGETIIDITPVKPTPTPIPRDMSPVANGCDPEILVCANAVINGIPGADYAQLVTSLNNLSVRLNNDELFVNINSTLEGVTATANKIGVLAETLNQQAVSLNLDELDLQTFTEAGSSAQQAAEEFRLLIRENRAQVDTTVANLTQLTANLNEITTALKPLLVDPQVTAQVRTTLDNITQASVNVAAATQNFAELSASLNDPVLVLTLRQTLDSARITFQNAQKITADLDQLTGDAQFRESLKNLVKGLSGLISYEQVPGSLLTTPKVALNASPEAAN